jgi:hypothetical protein
MKKIFTNRWKVMKMCATQVMIAMDNLRGVSST